MDEMRMGENRCGSLKATRVFHDSKTASHCYSMAFWIWIWLRLRLQLLAFMEITAHGQKATQTYSKRKGVESVSKFYMIYAYRIFMLAVLDISGVLQLPSYLQATTSLSFWQIGHPSGTVFSV